MRKPNKRYTSSAFVDGRGVVMTLHYRNGGCYAESERDGEYLVINFYVRHRRCRYLVGQWRTD